MTETGFLGVIGPADDIKIIGLCGRAGSGKDFIAEHFLQPLGYVPVALANGFKHKVIGMGNSIHDVFVEKPPDVRKLLQEEGTVRQLLGNTSGLHAQERDRETWEHRLC